MLVESSAAAVVPTEAKAPNVSIKDDHSGLLLFGLDLTRLKPSHRFGFLTFGSLFCALTFAALQEKVFLIEGVFMSW